LAVYGHACGTINNVGTIVKSFLISVRNRSVVSQDLISAMDEDIPEFYHNPEYVLYSNLINNEIKDVIASLLYLVTPGEVVKESAELRHDTISCSGFVMMLK
jgi:hypothetical protein